MSQRPQHLGSHCLSPPRPSLSIPTYPGPTLNTALCGGGQVHPGWTSEVCTISLSRDVRGPTQKKELPGKFASEAPETRQPCHHRRAAQGVPGAQSGASSPPSLALKASSRHTKSAVRTQATEVAVPLEILLLPKFGGTSAQPERNKQDFPHPQSRAWPLPSRVSRGKPCLPGKTHGAFTWS